MKKRGRNQQGFEGVWPFLWGLIGDFLFFFVENQEGINFFSEVEEEKRTRPNFFEEKD